MRTFLATMSSADVAARRSESPVTGALVLVGQSLLLVISILVLVTGCGPPR